jgi:hypothetical protein
MVFEIHFPKRKCRFLDLGGWDGRRCAGETYVPSLHLSNILCFRSRTHGTTIQRIRSLHSHQPFCTLDLKLRRWTLSRLARAEQLSCGMASYQPVSGHASIEWMRRGIGMRASCQVYLNCSLTDLEPSSQPPSNMGHKHLPPPPPHGPLLCRPHPPTPRLVSSPSPHHSLLPPSTLNTTLTHRRRHRYTQDHGVGRRQWQ